MIFHYCSGVECSLVEIHAREKKWEGSKHDVESLSTSFGCDVAHYDVFSYIATINGGGVKESALWCLTFQLNCALHNIRTSVHYIVFKTNSW